MSTTFGCRWMPLPSLLRRPTATSRRSRRSSRPLVGACPEDLHVGCAVPHRVFDADCRGRRSDRHPRRRPKQHHRGFRRGEAATVRGRRPARRRPTPARLCGRRRTRRIRSSWPTANASLSPDPNIRRRNDQPFAQLDYAIYFGGEPADGPLCSAPVFATCRSTVAPQQQAITFGNTELLLVMSADRTSQWRSVRQSVVDRRGRRRRCSRLRFAFLTRRLLDRPRHRAALWPPTTSASTTSSVTSPRRCSSACLPQHLVAPEGRRRWPPGTGRPVRRT